MPLHNVRPLPHAQVPSVQTWPPGQVAPHVKQPEGDGPQARAPQSLAIIGWVHAPAEQTSRVQATPSSVQPALDAIGTHAVPLHCWHSGHRVQRPVTHAPVAQVPTPHDATQPEGEGPHSRVPQSFASAGWVHAPSMQTSWVQRLASSGQEMPLVTGTQRVPS